MPFGQQCIKMVTVFGRLSCKWLKRFLWEESSHVHSFLPSFPSKPKTPSDAGGSVRKQQAPRAMPGAASILLSMAIIWGFWLWPRQNQAEPGFPWERQSSSKWEMEVCRAPFFMGDVYGEHKQTLCRVGTEVLVPSVLCLGEQVP